MTARRWLFTGVAGLAFLMVLGRLFTGVYAEWRWYAAMGALPLYQSKLLHETILRGGAALLGFGFAFANLYAVRNSIVSLVLPRKLGNLDFSEEVPGRRLMALVVMLSIVLAVVLAIPQDDWVTLALAQRSIPFGERDPYQDRDFGFYVYDIPLERSLHVWAIATLLLVGAAVVFLYALTPSLRWQRGRLHVSTYVRRHFGVLTALVLLLVGWSYRLEGVSLLTSGSGALAAYTSFDDKVMAPLLTGLSIAAFAASLVVLWAVWHGLRPIALTIFIFMALAGPGASLILPMLDRWSTTDASRAARERPYQSTRTQFTRRAFAVDQVIDADSSKVPPMTRQEAARGVSNWDQAALMRTAAISRRDLTAIASSWTPGPQGLTALIVQRPTSGSGPTTLTSLNVTSADEQGRPLPALPGQAETDESFPTVLVEPGAPAYAIVADSADDMPAAPFASWFDRLAHAWSLQKPSVLAHDVPELRPRILLHRDVRERIAALAPFLTIGPTLQSAVAADSLYWLAELFVTSDEYPLAQPLLFAGEPRQDGGGSRFSYIRHAATAVVHAHTGRVFIVADRGPDPVMRSWMQRFPWLFVSRDRLPAALGALWPPPVDRAAVQGDAIAHAGFPGDTIIPTRVAASRESAPDAPPLLYAQHGDAGPLSASIAVLESGERMVGVLLARGGREPGVEWHRAASKIPWRGVLDELSASAKRAGMYGTKRGADRRGFVQILPFSDGLGFTQSFYSWGSDAPPALHGVVLLEGGRSHPGATFAEALGISRPVPEGASVAFRSRVAALYETMRAAMRRGDWKVFGDAYATLGRLLHAAP